MGRLLLIPLAILPVEIFVFVLAARRVGVWPCLAAVLVTAVAGGLLLRSLRARFVLAQPLPNLMDAGLMFAAGVLLLAPGFVTDAAGLALLVPPVRSGMRRVAAFWLVDWIDRWLEAVRAAEMDELSLEEEMNPFFVDGEAWLVEEDEHEGHRALAGVRGGG